MWTSNLQFYIFYIYFNFKFLLFGVRIQYILPKIKYKISVYGTAVFYATMDHGSNGNMSSGSLRTKISLKGGYSQLSVLCPFYGMKQELPSSFLYLLN